MEKRNTGSTEVYTGNTEVNTGNTEVSTEVNIGSTEVNIGSTEVSKVGSTPSLDHWVSLESHSKVRSAVRRTMELEYSDDDQELSLASLGQLVVTVRACAREIREICDNPDNKASRTSTSTKRNENGRKKKADRSNFLNAAQDSEKRSKSGPMEERRICCNVSEEINQKTFQCKGAWKSAVNKSLSLSATPRTKGIQDTTIIQEKHILDKVVGRLNGSKTVWNSRAATAPQAKPSEHTDCKPAIVIRNQFSSYGPPLPGISPAGAEQLPVRNM